MTVSIIETVGGAVAAFASGTPTVTTSLVSTDRVVVIVSKVGLTGTPSVSGLSATWVTDTSTTTSQDMYVFSTTGVTGGGALTISGYSTAGDYVVYVLRSSVASTPTLSSGTANGSAAVVAGTLTSLSSVSAPAGSIVVAAGSVTTGTVDFPHASSSPSGGWTVDRTGTNSGKFISQAFPASTSVALSLTSSATAGSAIVRAIYSDGSGPTPLTSTFVGWGNPIF